MIRWCDRTWEWFDDVVELKWFGCTDYGKIIDGISMAVSGRAVTLRSSSREKNTENNQAEPQELRRKIRT
jgi:hypothetical protein